MIIASKFIVLEFVAVESVRRGWDGTYKVSLLLQYKQNCGVELFCFVVFFIVIKEDNTLRMRG